MRTLNDVDTYEDDYGNTKNMAVFDHSDKKIFSYSHIGLEKYNLEALVEKKKELDKRRNKILKLSSDNIKKLLNLFDHAILYDTELNSYQWDNKKINEILESEHSLFFIETLLNTGEFAILTNEEVYRVKINNTEDNDSNK